MLALALPVKTTALSDYPGFDKGDTFFPQILLSTKTVRVGPINTRKAGIPIRTFVWSAAGAVQGSKPREWREKVRSFMHDPEMPIVASSAEDLAQRTEGPDDTVVTETIQPWCWPILEEEETAENRQGNDETGKTIHLS